MSISPRQTARSRASLITRVPCTAARHEGQPSATPIYMVAAQRGKGVQCAVRWEARHGKARQAAPLRAARSFAAVGRFSSGVGPATPGMAASPHRSADDMRDAQRILAAGARVGRPLCSVSPCLRFPGAVRASLCPTKYERFPDRGTPLTVAANYHYECAECCMNPHVDFLPTSQRCSYLPRHAQAFQVPAVGAGMLRVRARRGYMRRTRKGQR